MNLDGPPLECTGRAVLFVPEKFDCDGCGDFAIGLLCTNGERFDVRCATLGAALTLCREMAIDHLMIAAPEEQREWWELLVERAKARTFH